VSYNVCCHTRKPHVTDKERKLTDTISFILDYVHRLKFLKHDVSEAGSASVFRYRHTKPNGPLRSSYHQSLVPTGTLNWFR